jgi:Lanthionine synthetase C-like protein
MSRTDNQNLHKKIENRLHRIANVLLLNSSFTDNPGLLNGKMGIAIFFYHYSRYTKNKIYEDYAGALVDEIYEEINTSTSVNFENGLTGIGWGIEYLVKNKFVQADTDEALADIDNTVYKHRLNNPILINSGDDLFGYGFYHVARILGHKIDDDDLNTLIKKYHLIFLADECERILGQKSCTRSNIKTLSIDTVNSFIWFLLEIQKLGIFPVKVEKIFHSVPDYIEKGIQKLSDMAGHALLLTLAEKTMDSVKDNSVRDLIKRILEKVDGEKVLSSPQDETYVSDFIKNTWQQIVYEPYFTDGQGLIFQFNKIFSIIDDEDNWNKRLENINKENLGITGLAGLALGLLRAHVSSVALAKEESSEHRAQSKKGQFQMKT